MNNNNVKQVLDDCSKELESISALILGLGEQAKPTPYLNKYAVIRATGSIETAFKQVIADKIDQDSHIQVKNYIKKKVRESSCNPKFGMIENMLEEFDSRWRQKFGELTSLADLPKLKSSLTELVNARNSFAHGGHPELDISTTVQRFRDGIEVITILDLVVHHDYETD